MRHQARKCRNADCALRFPVREGSPLGESCPLCGATTEFVDAAYGALPVADAGRPDAPRVEALLDNVRSLRNVGSIFRTADGAGVQHLHLAGFTPTPDHPRMAKTALGAERSVRWSRHADAIDVVGELVARGAVLWALEGGEGTRSLFSMLPELEARTPGPIVVVCGHEVSGVDPRVLAACEHRVHIPMAGIKDSLNVSVAFGIAVYWLRFAGATASSRAAPPSSNTATPGARQGL